MGSLLRTELAMASSITAEDFIETRSVCSSGVKTLRLDSPVFLWVLKFYGPSVLQPLNTTIARLSPMSCLSSSAITL